MKCYVSVQVTYLLDSKIMKIGKNGEANGVDISLNDRRMEEVETHRYLGVDMSIDSGMGEEVNHRITEAKKAREH